MAVRVQEKPQEEELILYRVRMTGGEIGTEQAARGRAAGHRQDEVR